jgi:hypothetical protein
MRKEQLTFDAVDDLVGAHVRRRLNQSEASVRFAPVNIGPLIELAFESSNGRHGPLLTSPWLDPLAQLDLRSALMGTENVWLDGPRGRGFLRTVFDPSNSDHDPIRTNFLMAARVSAESAGFPVSTAQSLTAAIREMESNVHEHSDLCQSGILAFQARNSSFEFVVADCGQGILATIRQASEYKNLSDHGAALYAALQEGVSRYGRAANRGNGFRDLFLGLAYLNANLRFRSGDHALTISGPRPEVKMARLDQKAHFRGFLASVQCRLASFSDAIH